MQQFALKHRFRHLFEDGDARNAPDAEGNLLFEPVWHHTKSGLAHGTWFLAPYEYVYQDQLHKTYGWYWSWD